MREDWNNQQLCAAWLNEMGTYGDLPRRMFVVPIILNLASNIVNDKHETLSTSMIDGVQKYAYLLTSEDYSPLQMPEILNLSGLNYLDLGCGQGYIQKHLSCLNAKYLGVDSSKELINKAKQNIISNQTSYLIWDLNQLKKRYIKDQFFKKVVKVFGKEVIQLILCHAIMEHLKNPEQFLSALKQFVKVSCPKAIISIIILNSEFFNPFVIKETMLGSSKYSTAVALLVPKTNISVMINIFSIERFQEMLFRSGIEILELFPFKKSLYSENLWNQLSLEYCIPNNLNAGPFFAITGRFQC